METMSRKQSRATRNPGQQQRARRRAAHRQPRLPDEDFTAADLKRMEARAAAEMNRNRRYLNEK